MLLGVGEGAFGIGVEGVVSQAAEVSMGKARGVWKGVWKSARKGEHVRSKKRAGVWKEKASAGRPEEVSRSSKGERG